MSRFASTMLLAITLLILTLATMPADGATKAVAPPPVDCTTVVVSMANCLSYVTNGSTTLTPEKDCCTGLKQVLKTSPACLCQAFQQSSQFGIVLNVTKALGLPAACHVHAPSFTNCGLSLAPAGAPAGAPGGAPFSSANAPSSSSGSNGTAPATAPSKNGSSSSIRLSAHFIVAGIAMVLFASF